MAAYATDGAGLITAYNDLAAELWGQHPSLGEIRWCGAWGLRDAFDDPVAPEKLPVARALSSQVELSEADVIIERPDRSRISIRSQTRVTFKNGAAVGSITLLCRQSATIFDKLQQERLAAIVSTSDDIIIGKTLDGIVTSWNAAATRILGYAPEEMIGKSITRIIPPELMEEETYIISKLRSGEKVDHFDTERLSKDGRRVALSLTVSPLRDELSKIVGASKIGRDITERRRAEDLQRRLFDELNHRVKNTLATVLALAKQSARRAVNPAQFAESFSGRVQALARVHDLLVRGEMVGSELASLVQAEVLVGAKADGRIEISGPPLILDPRTSGQIGLTLHELTTNAKKFGALSTATGQLLVEWKILPQQQELHFLWKESGAPAPVAGNPGFGMSLIRQTIEAAGGTSELKFREDGLQYSIRLPLSHSLAKKAGFDVGNESAGKWI
ncbi:histidine kinase [Cereibacter changlensis JA139]|uniref:histidine kinase n=3 Tax=Cereibacter changlensis TaxID=402884 RepID=A0A2T4JP23_9RHOB|nr:histidine kinase [Cereibacter changlensis JA139]PZX47742.1 PAS domain S-box-containing protein [Cereibacter changlensis]